jgi:hypothetical protein
LRVLSDTAARRSDMGCLECRPTKKSVRRNLPAHERTSSPCLWCEKKTSGLCNGSIRGLPDDGSGARSWLQRRREYGRRSQSIAACLLQLKPPRSQAFQLLHTQPIPEVTTNRPHFRWSALSRRPHFCWISETALALPPGRTPPAGEGGFAAAGSLPLSLYLGPRLVNAVSLRKRPNDCAKTAGAGAPPPPCAPRRPGWATPSPKPQSSLVTSPQMGGVFNYHSGQSHPLICFLCASWVRSSLYRLVLTRSRWPQLPKANHFWPIWPFWQAQRPSPAQQLRKIRWGGGAPPPLRPPPCAAAWRPGWATPSPKHQKKLRLRREVESDRSPRRTALQISQKAPCRNSVRLVVG